MLETPDHPFMIEHNGIKHYYQIETLCITFNWYTECLYSEYYDDLTATWLNVIMLSDIILSVIMMSDIMLSVLAPIVLFNTKAKFNYKWNVD